ncbi:A/G-specific adenine glycosylase [Candidatus Neomarinimicrobiota bacterium]
MSPSVLKSGFSKHLLQWYDQYKRTLPWRGTQDFYRIWLSEIMLQQTRVETVIPYYLQWLDLFPSIEMVANASEEEILKAWEGLGYYRRALLFQKACRSLMNDNHGCVPENPDYLRQLPGIGLYTFAAVRSICFYDPVPAVDGNARRVIARILMLSHSATALHDVVCQALLKVISVDRPGDFNQALMDLGSLICSPKNPRCDHCPLLENCSAFQQAQTAHFPVRRARPALPHHTIAAGIIWRDQQFLICKRPVGGLLGGLWELPGGKVEDSESLAEAVRREIREEVDLDVRVVNYIGAIRHAYSHFSIQLHIFNCAFSSGTPQTLGCTEYRWIRWEDIPHFPFPRANHKLFSLIQSSVEK